MKRRSTTPLAWEPAEPQALHQLESGPIDGPPPLRRRLSVTPGKPPVKPVPEWTPIRPSRTVVPRMRTEQVTEAPVGLDYRPPSQVATVVIDESWPEEVAERPSSWHDEEVDWFEAEPAPTMDPAPGRAAMAPMPGVEYALLAAVLLTGLAVLTASGAIVAALLY